MNELTKQLPEWETLPEYTPRLLTLMEFFFLPFLPGMLGGMFVGLITSIFVAAATAKTIGVVAAIAFTIVGFLGTIVYTRRELNRTVDVQGRLQLRTVVQRYENSSKAVLTVRAVDKHGRKYCQREFGVGEDIDASEYATQLQEAINESYGIYRDKQITQQIEQDAAVADLEGTQRALSAAL